LGSATVHFKSVIELRGIVLADEDDDMRVYSKINPKLKDSYLEVFINAEVRFIHKQAASWILAKEGNKLSADRLTRVIQMNKKRLKLIFFMH